MAHASRQGAAAQSNQSRRRSPLKPGAGSSGARQASPLLQRRLVILQVLPHRRGRVLHPGALQDQLVEGGRQAAAHAAADLLEVLPQADVAARAQQVAADGERLQAAGQQLGGVEAVGAGGIGDVQPALKIVLQAPGQRHGQRLQRPAAHVGRLLPGGQGAGLVQALQGVGQLDREAQAVLVGAALERAQQVEGGVVLEVVLEGLVGDLHLPAQRLVEQVAQALGAQQRRVQLDGGVQLALVEQVEADLLDLPGRAAVHGRQGDVVGDAIGDVQLGDARVQGLELAHQRLLLVAAAGHAVEEALHVGLADAGQVVADAEVEEEAGVGGEVAAALAAPQNVQQHPGRQVLRRTTRPG